MRTKYLISIVILCMTIFSCGKNNKLANPSKKSNCTIATGPQLGVYYTAGLGISDIVNENESKISISINATPGSVYNITALSEGNVDVAIVQNDHAYQAFKGNKNWENNKQENLRFICNLHTEAVSILARNESGIEYLNDLRYKSINIGELDSGTHQNAIDILNHIGIDRDTDVNLYTYHPEKSLDLIKSKTIDAIFLTAGQPNNILAKALASDIKLNFVPVNGVAVDKMMEKYPYYNKTYIPVRLYPNITNEEDVETVGITATLVATENCREEIVYAIIKNIFENISELKAKHPSLIMLTKPDMIKNDFMPVHPGAMRYYKEVGLR